jgi:hypothetical protein
MPQGRTKNVNLQSSQLYSREEKMRARRKETRLPTKFGFAMATVLAASFGFSGLTRAAPLAGLTAAVPAVQLTQVPSAAEALPEKAYHHGYKHRKYYKPWYKRHHGYKPAYKRHYGPKAPPSYPTYPEYPK